MSRRIFVHAPNVHSGGGRTLLAALLETKTGYLDLKVTLDERLELSSNNLTAAKIKRVKPSILGRIGAELWLRRNVKSGDSILCFGNLPPLFKLHGRVIVFVQNRLLVDQVNLDQFPMWSRLRLIVERYWLTHRLMNLDEVVVQTPSMRNLIEDRVKGKVKVSVFPFITNGGAYRRSITLAEAPLKREYDFVYVASGDPHKNHRRLIKAWCMLATEELYPSLLLTLDGTKASSLCSWIEQMTELHKLKIVNYGNFEINQIAQLYDKAGALIYPSTIESFGLPLVEARQAGLPVLASELDYVRDALDPEQSFNPQSSISIARAVKRYLGIPEKGLPLQDAQKFIDHIIDQN
jgi:glycosyltransferase involved in cell wall biosynthesis